MVTKEVYYYYPPVSRDGPTGINGLKGEKGDKGSVGYSGPPGPMGMKGDKGDFGHHGPKGTKGEKGEIGPIGHPGQKGEKGVDGLIGNKIINYKVINSSLYLILDDSKEIGPIIELPGPKGEKGELGERGMKGDMGTIGNKGDKGDKGLDGILINNVFLENNQIFFDLSNGNKLNFNLEKLSCMPTNLDNNLDEKIFLLGFMIMNGTFARVFTDDINRHRFYLSNYTEINDKNYNNNIVKLNKLGTNYDISMLKDLYYLNFDQNFKKLYIEDNEQQCDDYEKMAGSEWGIDPFPIVDNDNFTYKGDIYSSGHFILANGINISNTGSCRSILLNISSNVINKNNGFYTLSSDYVNNESSMLKRSGNITEIPNYQQLFFGNILINSIHYYITVKVFIRLEIHRKNLCLPKVKYMYRDANYSIKYDEIDVSSTQSAAFTLRAYTDWIGIGDNNLYEISDSLWNYRKKHSIYQQSLTDENLRNFSDPNKKHVLYEGDTLCTRISFSMPNDIKGHINSNGNIINNLDNFITNYSNVCFNDKSLKQENLNKVVDSDFSFINYWPGYFDTFLDVKNINLNISFKPLNV